MAIHSKGPNSL